METQPDIVAAAEALRTWVHAQRTTWAETIPAKTRAVSATSHAAVPKARQAAATPAAPVSSEPVAPRSAIEAAVPTATIEPAVTLEASEPISPRPSSLPPPVVLTEPVSGGAATPPAVARAAVQPSVTQAIHVDVDETGSSLFEKWRVAVAAALIIAVVGAGGRMVWRRSASAPRVGIAAFGSVPPGAQVFVDGKPVGTTPVRVELNPGPHGVEFKLKQATRTQTIDIKKGLETPVNVDWNPKRTGKLEVTSTPTARVLVDGRDRGQTPLTLDDLAVGTHTVQIDSTEGSVRRKVNIAAGETQTVAESIYPGWLVISAPIEVTVSDGGKGLQLDATNRVLMKPGVHSLRIDNRELEFSQTRQVEVEPGDVARVSVDVPPSTLTVTGSSGAEVFVDGVKAGETPLADFKVRIGTRDIMVVDKSGVSRHATVTVTTRPAHLDLSLTR